MTIGAVLLDLDGTLVDTAPDLVGVLNQMLGEQYRPPMPYAIARNEVSNGAVGLIRLGFGGGLDEAELESLRQRFLEVYTEQICIKSRLFNNLLDILNGKDPSHLPWGIVTNKSHAMTARLLERLGIDDQPASVVSGDRLPQKKPHPAPLQLAAREIGVPPAQCVYVGDALRDIQAGQAAGMRTIVAAYGYIRQSEDPHTWGADSVIRRPGELEAALAALRNGADA